MIHDIPKPILSPDFTIDDIHKIRDRNYRRFKDATREEELSERKKAADKVQKEIEEIRAAKRK